jgi:hypothetical protein
MLTVSGYTAMAAPNEASPSPPPKLHTRLRLWEFADRYLFEPVDGLADLFLSVNRTNGSMNLVEELPPRGPSANPKVGIVFGVMGVLRLAAGSYCLVITDRDCVGSYMGHAVFRVTGLKALPCHTTSSAEQVRRWLLTCSYGVSVCVAFNRPGIVVARRRRRRSSLTSSMLRRGLLASTSHTRPT